MLEKNFTEEHFIKMQNLFFKEKSEYRLSPDELYIYAVLYINRRYDDSIVVNVHMIEDLMWIPFIENNTKRNKKRILECLIMLINKKVLLLDRHVEEDSIKYDTTLFMEVNEDLLEKGWEKFDYLFMKNVKDVKHLYIYCATKRFTSMAETFNCSYDRWAKILDCSKTSAKKYVEDAIKNNIILVKRGTYIAKNKQAINGYYIWREDRDIEVEKYDGL